jgi:PAS domain S-box-containing protein
MAGYLPAFVLAAISLALAVVGPHGGVLVSGADVGSRLVPCLVVVLSTVTVFFRKYLGEREARSPSGAFAGMIDAAPIFIWACDREGNVTYVNAAWSEFTGVSQEEVEAMGWAETVHPDDRVDMEAAFERLAASPRPFSSEFRLRRHDGVYRWIFEQANPFYGEDRTFLGFVGNSVDVTERREVEDELRKSRETLEKAQEVGNVGSWRYDVASDRAEWSPQVYRMCGLDSVEWDKTIGSFIRDVLHHEDRRAFSEWATSIIRGHTPGPARYRIVRLDSGEERWLVSHADAFTDASGEICEVVGISRDVTEAHASAAAIAESRARLAAAERIAGMGHVEWDPATDEVVWSDGLFRLLGVEPGSMEAAFENYLEFVHPDDRGWLAEARRNSVRDEPVARAEHRLIRADGSQRIIRMRARLEPDSLTANRKLFTILQDVTERYRNEQALRDSEAFLSKAQEIAKLGSWTYDVETGERAWSREMYHILGLSPDDPIPSVESFIGEVVHPEDREAFETGWTRVLEEGASGQSEYRILRADGTERVVNAQGEIVHEAGGRGPTVVGTFQDVTEMRLAQNALQESEERFDLAARGANDGLWDWSDVNRDSLWISPRYFELLGYEDGAFSPDGNVFMGEIVHPDDRAANWDALAAHLERRQPYDVEFRLLTKDRGYRWFQTRGQAIFDENGTPLRMAGSAQDIHDRKVAEQKLDEYREQLRTLTWKAALAGEHERRRIGIELHDRTIQNLGLMRVRLAQLRGSFDERNGGALFEETFALVKETIRDTRALLSELSPPVLYELGFVPGVDWLAERVRAQHGLDCRVADDGADKPLGEDSQVILFQAVRELLANAAKHAEAETVRVYLRRDGDDIRISVEDDGKGFDAGDSPSMTESGGFGLFSIGERMRFLGGELSVRSSPGRGTVAELHAPLAGSLEMADEFVA